VAYNNSDLFNFTRSGKKILVLNANDTAGNVISKNITFYINRTLNISKWLIDFNDSASQVDSIGAFNSSDNNISQNITADETVSLEINLTNTTVNIYNFTTLNAVWDYLFPVKDSSSYFESQINSIYGTSPVDYVYMANFTNFLNMTNDYYGKVKLPRNISYYDHIYFCTNEDLTGCQIISTCSGNYGESATSACYSANENNTIVYIPHFSAVFGGNDTVAPIINITTPSNNSVVNSSYNNDLIFSTNENSTCTRSVDGGSYASVSSSDSRYYSTTYNLYTNDLHNISINCTHSKNARLSTVYFNINDTTAPSYNSGPSVGRTTSTITFTFTPDEPANYSISLSGETAKSSSSYSTSSQSVEFTGLNDDTKYYYNITVCDQLGNCGTTTGSKTTSAATTTTTNTGSSGGSSGGTGTSTSTSSSAKVSQQFTDISAGTQTMSVPSTAIAFTYIIFTLKNPVNGTFVMTVEKRDLPSFISALAGKIYQYIEVNKAIIKDSDVSSAIIKFRVEKSWINSNSIDPDTITLYRYTTQWNKLETTETSDDSTYYYYESNSPGMSYFAIKGNLMAATQETQQTPSENNQSANTGEVIKEVQQQPQTTPPTISKFPVVIIPIIIVVLIIGGVLGFLYYQKNISVLSDNELRELNEYVSRCKAEGIDSRHIKAALLKAGWQEYVVDLVLHDVHVPHDDMSKLKAYITAMKKAKQTDPQIRENLRRVGWQEEVIEEAFNIKKK
jgi:PGF-pre-PGF domain-containing protein